MENDKPVPLNAPKDEKECAKCHQPFKPRSGRQKYCDSCRESDPRICRTKKEKTELSFTVLKGPGSGRNLLKTGQQVLDELGVNKIELEGEFIIVSVKRIVKE